MNSKSIMFVGILALISFHSIAKQQQTPQDIKATAIDLREMAEQLNLDRYGNQGISWPNNPLDLRNYQIPFKYVKPEHFIPKKYVGDQRDEISELLQQLQGLCPDCKNIHELPSNNYRPIRPSTPLEVDPVLQDKCSVPDWLRKKKGALTVYSFTKDIPYPENGCERETVSALIDNIVKNKGE
ncbi:hypothetical protein [Alteromonas macleodii]|uniref:hypothetical protein n=1 Tax=Alteromonas macleodii TaxID=28108 RepID=UPI0031401098